MARGFWAKIKRPFFALAPMADVTDAAFRRIIAKYGKPDVMWTEFVSCDGLVHQTLEKENYNLHAREKFLKDLEFTENERPIVVQFFGANPESFYRCALLAQELKFDGIDINMGCPDKAVEKQWAGAALIKSPELAKKIIYETKRGAGKLPVSVKTRLGYNRNTLEEWLPYLLETEPAAITVHARTRKEMSKVPADWDAIRDAVDIAKKYYSSGNRPLIIGNGDVKSVADGLEKAKTYNADGIMVGRAVFGNPWLFADLSRVKRGRQIEHPAEGGAEISCQIPVKEKLKVMLEHTRLFEKYFGNSNSDRAHALKNFDVMKKHFKAYVSGFNGAKELRVKLMTAKTAGDINDILKDVDSVSKVLKKHVTYGW